LNDDKKCKLMLALKMCTQTSTNSFVHSS